MRAERQDKKITNVASKKAESMEVLMDRSSNSGKGGECCNRESMPRTMVGPLLWERIKR